MCVCLAFACDISPCVGVCASVFMYCVAVCGGVNVCVWVSFTVLCACAKGEKQLASPSFTLISDVWCLVRLRYSTPSGFLHFASRAPTEIQLNVLSVWNFLSLKVVFAEMNLNKKPLVLVSVWIWEKNNNIQTLTISLNSKFCSTESWNT